MIAPTRSARCAPPSAINSIELRERELVAARPFQKKVSDIVAEIAAASEAQAQGIDQLNNAVTQMDDTTQQNAALVEEAASAAKSMEQPAQQLVTEISFFRTAGNQAPIASTVASTKPSASVRPLARPAAKRPAAKPAARPAPAPVPMAKASGDDSAWQEF